MKRSLMVQPAAALHGDITVPGDKSISHRAVLLGALGDGQFTVKNWLSAGDTEASLQAVQDLGIPVERPSPTTLILTGGMFQPPDHPLNLRNTGTGLRLLAGILAAQPFESILDGSSQLRQRPMGRIIDPLRRMGAEISGMDGYAPLHIKPAALRGIDYTLPVASAQVKSAILLAGLFAQGETILRQNYPSRDHTERMLQAMGANLTQQNGIIHLQPGNPLKNQDISIPGDLSAAAFPLAAALIVPDSDITLHGVNLNPTRTGLLDVLTRMGANLTITKTGTQAGEPVGRIHAQTSELHGIEIGGAMIPRLIDEIPILMVIALHAEGQTLVRDAAELRVKESDRLSVMTAQLHRLGASITETPEGFRLVGKQHLTGAVVDSHEDHRVAMSLAIAGLVATGETVVRNSPCIGDSFPDFVSQMKSLGAPIRTHTW
ncbi:MAG: 3-phosphoshikimate 1-carboxyvinyltransferase [Gemmatimonadetes bacterium]|nr:MAG: 3-phosphoshikimate 1-carboxyvinyltransferase [Gemmatimonadota bacterium]